MAVWRQVLPNSFFEFVSAPNLSRTSTASTHRPLTAWYRGVLPCSSLTLKSDGLQRVESSRRNLALLLFEEIRMFFYCGVRSELVSTRGGKKNSVYLRFLTKVCSLIRPSRVSSRPLSRSSRYLE